MELEILRDLIEDIFEVEDVDENTDLYDDLYADEADLTELAYACSEEFDLDEKDFDDRFFREARTIGDLAKLIGEYRGGE